ncbi:hypothetical protein K402DRAFT_242921 [Aulographum hederae CBS 113979]|uniref:Uncharacterized protein n=1 Tax=Aulographum hederae CBS 113979 TaxID=1176131 RepID=A0A6G1H9R7_9PEZI|nr:hypothetical protein K402DRAFT_242921 [Aulographum hederae CBS 113979]
MNFPPGSSNQDGIFPRLFPQTLGRSGEARRTAGNRQRLQVQVPPPIRAQALSLSATTANRHGRACFLIGPAAGERVTWNPSRPGPRWHRQPTGEQKTRTSQLFTRASRATPSILASKRQKTFKAAFSDAEKKPNSQGKGLFVYRVLPGR